jgi:protoporphyrin/coproporphyrin ferrochelatase
MNLPPGHPPILPRKTGLLLLNLGTPEAPDAKSLRVYLKEFLSDRRVIETNRVLWWIILNGVILNIRPKKSAHAYEQIWNKTKNESPLKTFTRAQTEKVAEALKCDKLVVDWALWQTFNR